MRFIHTTVAHADLSGVSSDQHHAQAHRATHEDAGNDMIGQAAIRLANSVSLTGRNAAGTGNLSIALISSSNRARLGNTANPLEIYNNGSIFENDGTEHTVLSTRRHRQQVKAADETVNNSTTLQNDDELVQAVEASQRYRFIACLRVISSAVADFKFAFTVPTGATIVGALVDSVGYSLEGSPEVDLTAAYVAALNGANVWFLVHGVIETSTTAGNLTLQWAQNTAEVSDTKVLEGSSLELLRE